MTSPGFGRYRTMILNSVWQNEGFATIYWTSWTGAKTQATNTIAARRTVNCDTTFACKSGNNKITHSGLIANHATGYAPEYAIVTKDAANRIYDIGTT